MIKLTIILASVMFAALPAIAQTDDYQQALRLYEKGLLGRSEMMFDDVSEQTRKADPAGYSVLCDVMAVTPGYERRIEEYAEAYPDSAVLYQIRYQHALNLFDNGDYN